ncbi:hypothetical protein [Oceanithermus sp.]
MANTSGDYINLEAVAARLHHEVRNLEPMRQLREAYEVDEEEMLERLAALFGYESAARLPAPKSEYDIEVDEQIVAW